MIIFRSTHSPLFRYDSQDTADLILRGSIKVTTLEACRTAEKAHIRDDGEGTKIITSLPGINSVTNQDFRKLFGEHNDVDISPNGGFVTNGSNAVRNEVILPNAFVFCVSMLETDYMKQTFGEGCVKIKAPRTFFELVDRELRKHVPCQLSDCVVDVVEYTSRTNNYRDHTNKHIAFKKPAGPPRDFEKEAEVRALWEPIGAFAIEPVIFTLPEIQALLERMSGLPARVG